MVRVFSSRPLLGNPVAVVLDADGLDTDAMQATARWTNLSETTFVLPPTTPEADDRLRIFVPPSELPSARHPTLGATHAVLEADRVKPRDGRLVQECGFDFVNLTVTGEGADRRLTLDLPPATVTPLQPADIAEPEAILGCRVESAAVPSIVHVGAIWAVAQFADAASVLNLKPDFARLAEFRRE
jgi:PhzF family phenazine biosynthesis protein